MDTTGSYIKVFSNLLKKNPNLYCLSHVTWVLTYLNY